MTSLFLDVEEPTVSSYSTHHAYNDYPSLKSIGNNFNFGDSKLTVSLALITCLADSGFKQFDAICAVLNQVKITILALMRYCIEVDHDAYADYVQALSRKVDVVLSKLVTPALAQCAANVAKLECQHVIQNVSELVELIYNFANPLKIRGILVDYGLSGPNGVHIPSLETNRLLATSRKLQNALFQETQFLRLQTDDVSRLLNKTPTTLFVAQLVSASHLVSLLTLTIINNTVPTSVVFLYFLDLLRKESLTILDLEYFEEFLAHFARINDQTKLESAPLFDFHKEIIKDHFLQVIETFPSRPLCWATPAQAINHLQAFIDVFNEVYEEEIIMERVFNNDTGQENTVIRRLSCNGYNEGHYKFHVNPPPPPQVPDFVNFFNSTEATSNKFRFDSEDSQIPWKKQKLDPNEDHAPTEPSFEPAEPRSQMIFLLNENVATDVRDHRAEQEKYVLNKVTFKHSDCFKCKFIPWHKHPVRHLIE